MAIRGKDGLSGGTGGSRAFINNLNRVRKNTNAVAGAAKPKPDRMTQLKTNAIQKNSVKKDYQTYSTKDIDSLVRDVSKTVDVRKTALKKTVSPAPKKVVAKKAVKQKTNGLSAKAERGINWEKLNRLDRLN